jgi:hypothetical protein
MTLHQLHAACCITGCFGSNKLSAAPL